jgi:hypothetical protein
VVPYTPYLTIKKVNITADCSENQFYSVTCVTVHRQMEAAVEAPLFTNDGGHPLISDPVTSQKKYNP